MTVLVRDLMSRQPITVSAETSLMEARRLLRLNDIRHLPVVDGDRVVGMISDRDVLLRDRQLIKALDRLRSDFVDGRYRRVRDVMTAPVVTVEPGTTAAVAAAILRRHHISGLPVVERGRLVGIATTSDLLAAFSEQSPPGPLPQVTHPSWDAVLDADPSEPLGAGDPRPGRAPEPPRALVIDPDAGNRSLLAGELSAQGYSVWTCPGPCSPTECPARHGGEAPRCPRVPADLALIMVDQASARTALLEAYAVWAPEADIEITGTLTSEPGLHAGHRSP